MYFKSNGKKYLGVALIPPSFQPFGLLKFRNLVIERRLVRFIRLHRNRRFVAKKNRFQKASSIYCKVHIFREGHKFLQNLNCRFVLCSNCQISCGDFAKFCGLLRIYELYMLRGKCSDQVAVLCSRIPHVIC